MLFLLFALGGGFDWCGVEIQEKQMKSFTCGNESLGWSIELSFQTNLLQRAWDRGASKI